MPGSLPTPSGATIGEDIAVESGVADSLVIIGSAVAPAANAQLGNVLTPPAGIYEFAGQVTYTEAAPAAADVDNVYVAFNATSQQLGLADVQNVVQPFRFRKTLDGAHNVTMNAAGNATALVRYTVFCEVRRVA